jgi:hypothetical protein
MRTLAGLAEPTCGRGRNRFHLITSDEDFDDNGREMDFMEFLQSTSPQASQQEQI